MNYTLLFFLAGAINFSSCRSSTSENQINVDSVHFDQIYPYALRGEMLKMFEILNSFDEGQLTHDQRKLKTQYIARFLDNSEEFPYNTSDSEIIDLYDKFLAYWKSVVMEESEPSVADSQLMQVMMDFLKSRYKPDFKAKEIKKNYYSLFQEYFKSKGMYGLAMGKTGHLYDLYLWKDEEVKVYDVELPEETVEVTVVFMKDFISNGWSHYTTFGKRYSGGWATSDKLFCVNDAYDRTTEEFKISYLSHEGQHFADYRSYPKLQQADLEYRAKLTQLALANETVYDLIEVFIENGINDKNTTHPFANYCVIRDLSAALLKAGYNEDIDRLKNISRESINNASKDLLSKHSKNLRGEGAKTVERLIK